VINMGTDEERDGVALTNLDQPLFDEAGATKRDLVDYMERMADVMVPHLTDRPLSVIRVRPGQPPFMQKNLPKYTPDWVRSTPVWADRPKREVTYALANDRRTLIWFANQRAVEYHPALMRAPDWEHQTHLILDLDPPSGVDREEGFRLAVRAAHLIRRALDEAGLSGAVKTSGAKGVHVFVPLLRPTPLTSPRRPGRSPPGPSASTPTWPRRRSSSRSDTAGSSWTRPGPAGRR
jgi:DNA ligase D-like protein (predicted polymerase)